MDKLEKVRKRIRSARLEKEYTKDYLGKKLGMSQKSYNRLENGHSELKVKTLLKLSTILEVNVAHLLGI